MKDGIPLTKLLIISNVLTMIVIALLRLNVLFNVLAFDSSSAIAMPWTLVTYPLVTLATSGNAVISLLFAGYWLWWAGGSLERSWGTTRFAVFFFMMSAITAAGLFLGAMLLSAPGIGASGLWLPIAGVTIAFAMLNPEQTILFMFIIPLKLKYLAIVSAAVVFFQFAISYPPLMGFFALLGCAFSYWYVRSRASYSSESRGGQVVHLYGKKNPLRKLNPFTWYKEYRERKRLRDFFDKSGFKD